MAKSPNRFTGLRNSLTALLIALWAPWLAQAKAPTEDEVVFELNQILFDAAGAARKAGLLGEAEIVSLQRNVDELQQRLRELKGGIPRPYLDSFAFDTQALRRALAKPEGNDLPAVWRAIGEDIDLKLAFVRSSAGITGNVSPVVTVSISTYKGEEEIRGAYFVQCNPRLVADEDPAFYNSPRPAPVDQLRFLPGQYVCFLVSKRVRVSSQPVSVGLSEGREEQIRLPVP